jgi:histidinol-phosphate/aromatic aminotransferase/cobyric acid decarboxylase-like protein
VNKNEHCFHGGDFWSNLDSRFQSIPAEGTIINADVLDAWFSPSPKVIESLNNYLPYWQNMSPPTFAEGLVAAIAEKYQILEEEILVGAGSSALWFLFALRFLTSDSKVLLIEPSYGEYFHVCNTVVGCNIDQIVTPLSEKFRLDLDAWSQKLNSDHFNLAVLINPNNPTGIGISREEILKAIKKVPASTQILVDEAYMDFWDPDQSLLSGPLPPNVTVISSFSKRFALSGLRVAMLRTSPTMRDSLALRTPPWAVSLPAQIGACAALRDEAYYRQKFIETIGLRNRLKMGLEDSGYETIDSCANWLMMRVSDAERFYRQMASRGLYVRNIGLTAPSLGNEWIRIAVKDHQTNMKMLDLIG